MESNSLSRADLEVPSRPPTSVEEVAIFDDSIQSASRPGGERGRQAVFLGGPSLPLCVVFVGVILLLALSLN